MTKVMGEGGGRATKAVWCVVMVCIRRVVEGLMIIVDWWRWRFGGNNSRSNRGVNEVEMGDERRSGRIILTKKDG